MDARKSPDNEQCLIFRYLTTYIQCTYAQKVLVKIVFISTIHDKCQLILG